MTEDEDPYDGPITAMLRNYPNNIGTLAYARMAASYYNSRDYRTLIDAARKPLLDRIARMEVEIGELRMARDRLQAELNDVYRDA